MAFIQPKIACNVSVFAARSQLEYTLVCTFWKLHWCCWKHGQNWNPLISNVWEGFFSSQSFFEEWPRYRAFQLSTSTCFNFEPRVEQAWFNCLISGPTISWLLQHTLLCLSNLYVGWFWFERSEGCILGKRTGFCITNLSSCHESLVLLSTSYLLLASLWFFGVFEGHWPPLFWVTLSQILKMAITWYSIIICIDPIFLYKPV